MTLRQVYLAVVTLCDTFIASPLDYDVLIERSLHLIIVVSKVSTSFFHVLKKCKVVVLAFELDRQISCSIFSEGFLTKTTQI